MKCGEWWSGACRQEGRGGVISRRVGKSMRLEMGGGFDLCAIDGGVEECVGEVRRHEGGGYELGVVDGKVAV